MTNTLNGIRYQPSVTYTVPTDSPIRLAGSHNVPFRIINTRTEGAIWLSENPGIRAGQGVPVNPGTSLQWTRPTELFAVAELPNAEIIVTNEVDDWQPDPASIAAAILAAGIPIVTRTEVVFDSVVFGTWPLTLDMPFLDVRSVEISLIALSLPAGTAVITTEFVRTGPSTDLVYRQAFASTVDPGHSWTGTFPTPDQPTQIVLDIDTSIAGTGAEQFYVQVVASTAPVESLEQIAEFTSHGQYLLNQGGLGVAAGAVTNFNVSPWYGELELRVRFLKAAGAAPIIDIADLDQNAVFTSGAYWTGLTAVAAGTRWALIQRYAMAGSAHRITFQNLDGANAVTNLQIAVVPVTGGLTT